MTVTAGLGWILSFLPCWDWTAELWEPQGSRFSTVLRFTATVEPWGKVPLDCRLFCMNIMNKVMHYIDILLKPNDADSYFHKHVDTKSLVCSLLNVAPGSGLKMRFAIVWVPKISDTKNSTEGFVGWSRNRCCFMVTAALAAALYRLSNFHGLQCFCPAHFSLCLSVFFLIFLQTILWVPSVENTRLQAPTPRSQSLQRSLGGPWPAVKPWQ